MQLTKHIRLLIFSALISITASLNAQSTRSIVKGGTENGEFSGGVFIGWGAKITGNGTTSLLGTDSTSIVLWKDLIGVTQIGNVLTKTASAGWGNSGGATNNKLDTLENGWVDCKINSLNAEFAFGLSVSNPDADFDNIMYAVLVDSGQINVYNLGVLIGNYGSAAVNDSIRIERIGNILFYTKNGIVFLNQELNAKQPLLVDVAIYTSGASVAISTTGRTAVNAYFRTAQTGNWNQTTTWEISSDSISWTTATTTPDNNSKSIEIQSFDTVTITSSLSIDQTLVNGTLIYGNNAGSTITIADGIGTDLIVNGTFQDISPNSIVWSDSSTWLLGNSISPMFPSGTLLRTRNTSADNWRNHYYNGISNIPATANWIIRKTGTDNPLLSSVPGMYYPNLTIENTSGSIWTASDSSGFIGSDDYPRIKGVFNIGGSGTHPVIFVNQNTDSIPIWVGGNLTVKSGSTLHNLGTGFNVGDSMNIFGAYTGIKNLFLSGGNLQTISNTTFSVIKTLQVNKSGGYLRFDVPVEIDSLLSLTKGYIVTDSINILTVNNGATIVGGSDSSYVSGPVKKIGNTAFTFPLGDPTLTVGPYHPISITAPVASTDAFTTQYFAQGQTAGVAMDSTLESLSTCEHWNLTRSAGTSTNLKVSLGWNTNSCNLIDYTGFKVTNWNGVKWINLGREYLEGNVLSGTLGSDVGVDFSSTPVIPITIAEELPSILVSHELVNLKCSNVASKGSISLTQTPLNGVVYINYNYNWKKFNFNSSPTLFNTIQNGSSPTVNNLDAGWYLVNITAVSESDPSQTLNINKYYHVGYDVVYTDLVNGVAQNDTKVIRNSGNGDDGGFASMNTLKENTDGSLAFMYDNTFRASGTDEVIGLSYQNDDESFQTIDYAFLIRDNTFKIYENGVALSSAIILSSGDRLAISRKGNLIKYWRNEIEIRNIAGDYTKKLIIDGTILGAGSYFDNVIPSFCTACDIVVQPATVIPLCPGETVQLDVSLSFWPGANNPKFNWDSSNGLSCFHNCASPVLDGSNADAQYEISAYANLADYEMNLPCGVKTITIIKKESCDQEQQILGCCFSNYGAGVYVSPSTHLNVYCNLLNELGGVVNGVVEKGEFENTGSVNVELDWIHNAKNELYITHEGTTSLFGLNQKMRGNSNTHYNNLNLFGNGVKELLINEYSHANLDLTSNELAIGDNEFFMKNIAASITRTTGFASTDGAGVGYFYWAMQTAGTYLFPMGSSASALAPGRYRPLEILNGNASDEFEVNFVNAAPVSIDKAPNVLSVNSLYYHKIKHSSTTADNVMIKSYFPANEGQYQSLAHWEKDPQQPNYWWGSTPGSNASSIVSTLPATVGLINALTDGVQNFDAEPFVLAQSGFYINTTDFGNNGATGGTGNTSDTNNNGVIDNGEVSGDCNGDGQIGMGEVAGDINCDGATTSAEQTGDCNGDGVIIAPEYAGDVNCNGVIDNDEIQGEQNTGTPENNGVTITITSPNTGGGVNDPYGTGSNSGNTGTGGNTILTPYPVAGDYTMTITPNDCGIPGRIDFTIAADGTIDPAIVKYGLADANPALGALSSDVYTIDNVNSGLSLTSTPINILTECANSIKVSMGSDNNIVLIKSTEQINISIPTTITGTITLSPFKMYDDANTLVYTSSSLIAGSNAITAWPVTLTPLGVYHFEFDITAGSVNETIKGQFILK